MLEQPYMHNHNYSMLGGSGNLSALLSMKTEQNPLDGC